MSNVVLGERLERWSSVRDAVHVCVVPVRCGEDLQPGQRVAVRKTGSAGRTALVAVRTDDPTKEIGVVDPFLKGTVEKGTCCYLCLDPGQVTDVRHNWDHRVLDGSAFQFADHEPSEFPDEPPPPGGAAPGPADGRAGFLAAIRADPQDDTARAVYADWLDERGESALAGLYRAGRGPAMQWLDSLAQEYEMANGQTVVAIALEALGETQAGGDPVLSFPLNGPAADLEVDEKLRDLFWNHIEVVTGVRLDAVARARAGYSCDCY